MFLRRLGSLLLRLRHRLLDIGHQRIYALLLRPQRIALFSKRLLLLGKAPFLFCEHGLLLTDNFFDRQGVNG